MKLIHLGDLHLGKHVNEFHMIEDQKYMLEQIIDLIKQEAIDAVLLAGDIFDRSVPSEEAVKVLDEFLTKMAEMGKQVFAVSGNHDSDERLNYGSRLFEKNNIYIAGRYDGTVRCIDIEDAYGPLHIWLMPYVKASRVAHYFPEEKMNTYDDAFQTALKHCSLQKEERNVIVVHQFVTGSSVETEPELAGSETILLNVGTVDRISADCFDDFDYVAMGHIHSSQAVGRETCRYSGSLLKYSLNERELNRQKTIPIITLKEKGNVTVDLVSIKPKREIRHIRGQLQELLCHAEDTEDYIYATLTDERSQFDAMARLREVYPRVMKMDYDNQETRALMEEDAEFETEGKSFEELINGFFNTYRGTEPSREEWEVLMEVAREAGVIE